MTEPPSTTENPGPGHERHGPQRQVRQRGDLGRGQQPAEAAGRHGRRDRGHRPQDTRDHREGDGEAAPSRTPAPTSPGRTARRTTSGAGEPEPGAEDVRSSRATGRRASTSARSGTTTRAARATPGATRHGPPRVRATAPRRRRRTRPTTRRARRRAGRQRAAPVLAVGGHVDHRPRAPSQATPTSRATRAAGRATSVAPTPRCAPDKQPQRGARPRRPASRHRSTAARPATRAPPGRPRRRARTAR